MAKSRYGIPVIENEGNQLGRGGRYQGAYDVSSLYAGARQQEMAARAMMERARMARLASMKDLGGMLRRGIQGPQVQKALQMQTGITPAQGHVNPMLSALAGHQMSQAMGQASLDEMRRIYAANRPSAFEKYGPTALALAGMFTGGLAPAAFGATGALGGAAAGMSAGSGLGALITSY